MTDPHAHLRSRTAEAHARLDDLAGPDPWFGTTESYARWLAAQAAARSAVYGVLGEHLDGRPSVVDALRSDLTETVASTDTHETEAPCLASGLAELARTPQPCARPVIEAGARYVLEGSLRGGPVLRRALRIRLPGACADRFLRLGDDRGRWQATLAEIGGLGRGDLDLAVEAATTVFDTFEASFRRFSSGPPLSQGLS